MFKATGAADKVPAYHGYGLGGVKGIKGLPERICNMVLLWLVLVKSFIFKFQFRDRHRSKRKATSGDGEYVVEEADIEPAKKGKPKYIYGVNNKKWYSPDSCKSSMDDLKLAGKVADFEEREQLFDKNRPALMKIIRFFIKNSFLNFTFVF